jgi:hypothetical protein
MTKVRKKMKSSMASTFVIIVLCFSTTVFARGGGGHGGGGSRGSGGGSRGSAGASHSAGVSRYNNGSHGESHVTTHTSAPKVITPKAIVQHMYSMHPTPKTEHVATPKKTTTTSPNVARDSHGKIERSAVAKHAFEKDHPCPATGKTSGACPGYVVDHIKPLATGGADTPSNMQWQTTEEGKLKDKTERK